MGKNIRHQSGSISDAQALHRQIYEQQSMTHTQQVKCPICQFPANDYSTPAKTYDIYKCAKCGLEHTYPIPTEQQLKNFYNHYNDVRADAKVTQLNSKRQLEMLKNTGLTKNETILDFGAGDGEFVKAAGENCYGVDFRNSISPRIFQNISQLPTKQFDYITLWGVLEHLRDPVHTIKELSDFLKSRGKIAITTVDAEGAIPYYYKPVEHLTYWTRNSFAHLFGSCGMQLISSRPYIMLQKKEVYLNRLLSRTPEIYQNAFALTLDNLPQYVEVPTNEVIVISQKIK